MRNCDTCRNAKCNIRSTGLICCSNYRPKLQTNADRIRAMSDEELAAFIDEPTMCEGHGLGDCMNKECDKCILEWLQQPADEG